jgi:tagaturonate reductase
LDETEAFAFADDVVDRFKNPQIKHQWLSSSMNYTSKLKLRVLPVLLNHIKNFEKVPELIAIGFAAYIRFMKPVSENGDKIYGEANGVQYHINDTQAAYLAELWKNHPQNIVETVLKDISLWGKPLTEIQEFSEAVAKH